MDININFSEIDQNIRFKSGIKNCIKEVIELEQKKLGTISFIFTSNHHILSINKQFLNHQYYTDVITFAENRRNSLSGDIFISVDQLSINAKKYGTDLIREVSRVMVHGVLHLIGYNDQTENERKVMREKEDTYLCKFNWNEFIEEREM